MSLTSENIKQYEAELLKYASNSECRQDQRGALVIRDGVQLGGGWNASPLGKCTTNVCFSRVPVPGVSQSVTRFRSCSNQVEHAEAMAIRHAVIMAVSLDSRTNLYAFDDSLNSGEYRPLADCDLFHLNTDECKDWLHQDGNENAEKLPACQYCNGTQRIRKPSSRRGCAPCAVQAMNRGIARIWLLHDTGWTCYSMDDYYEMAVS